MGDAALNADAATLLTVTQAAEQTGVSRHIISSWITRGLLPAMRVNGRRYIRPADLAATQAAAHLGDVLLAWRQDRWRVGTRLRALREVAGLSQLQLAAASGLTHEAISKLERGKRSPHAASVHALAQALRVTPERFVGHDPVGLTMLTVIEAANRLEVPVARVRTWLAQGLLVGTKVSGQWRVGRCWWRNWSEVVGCAAAPGVSTRATGAERVPGGSSAAR